MIALTSPVLALLTTSLLAAIRPDTGAHPDTIHARQISADTIRNVHLSAEIATDRRIRLTLIGGSVDKRIATTWMNADMIHQWLDVVYHVSVAHELSLTGEPLDCDTQHDTILREDSIVGRLFALGSSIALTPLNIRGVSFYKVDIMDMDQDRTATFGVTYQEKTRIISMLEVAVKASRLLSDAELRKDGPLAIQSVRVDTSSVSITYPKDLLHEGMEGRLYACFAVDTVGKADMKTFRAMQSTNPAFTRAARMSVFHSRFTPASIEGHKYRMDVMQPFTFTISTEESSFFHVPRRLQ